MEYPNLPLDDQGKESEEVGMQGDDQGVGFMSKFFSFFHSNSLSDNFDFKRDFSNLHMKQIPFFALFWH